MPFPRGCVRVQRSQDDREPVVGGAFHRTQSVRTSGEALFGNRHEAAVLGVNCRLNKLIYEPYIGPESLVGREVGSLSEQHRDGREPCPHRCGDVAQGLWVGMWMSDPLRLGADEPMPMGRLQQG